MDVYLTLPYVVEISPGAIKLRPLASADMSFHQAALDDVYQPSTAIVGAEGRQLSACDPDFCAGVCRNNRCINLRATMSAAAFHHFCATIPFDSPDIGACQ